MAKEVRNWKQAYDPDFDENAPNGAELKTGLSLNQKHFIKDMWTLVVGSWHCIFPTYVGDRMVECGETEHVEAHHVEPQGASKRLNEDPDRVDNIVPLCEVHHRKGQRGKPLTREEQDVVHLDSAWANRVYKDDKDGYNKVGNQRSELLDRGTNYWVPFWDTWFRTKAKLVSDQYHAENPDVKFPITKHRK